MARSKTRPSAGGRKPKAATGQLDALPPAATKKDGLRPLTFTSADDREEARLALEERVDSVRALAEKNRKKGFRSAAHMQESKANAVKDLLLSQFGSQAQLDLSAKNLEEGLRALFGPVLRKAIAPKLEGGDAKKLDAVVKGATNDLCTELWQYVAHVADVAWDHGFNSRPQDAGAIPLRCIETYKRDEEKKS